MTASLGRIASFLSVALLAGILPAQEKLKTMDELRKENAALRLQVKLLRSQLAAKESAKDMRRGAVKVRLHIPVLNTPIELDLGWPLLSKPLDKGEVLYFSFRRFWLGRSQPKQLFR